MKRRKLLSACTAAVVAALFAAAPAGAQTVLKFSHTDQPGGLRHRAAEMFAQKIEQYTQGRYKMQVFPAGQLANDAKSLEQLQLGGIDLAVTGTVTYSTHIPELNLTALPFILETYEQGWKYYDESKWLKSQFDKGPAKGFRVLATWEAGFRSITTKDPLRTPDDARGKKLRIAPVEMFRWTMEALGFGVQILPIPEVYLAIQQGAVAGQENPVDTIYANKFYEVAPNITLTQHVYSPIPVAMAEKTWARISAADREAIVRACREVADWSRREVRDAEDKQLKDMASKGAKIARPDLAPFRAAVQPVFAKAREKFGKDVDAALADAEAIRKALPAK